MSFCPTKDIHSVYLDNELPETYKKEYELHVQNCPKCQKELEIMRGLSSMLKADSDAVTPDSHFVDQSFERLQIKMAYSKNTFRGKEPKKSGYFYGIAGVAAAAVFALVIPLRMNNPSASNMTMNPVAGAAVSSVIPSTVANAVATSANNVSFDSGRSVLVSGNIQETVLSSEPRRRSSAPFTREVKDVEVFRPELGDETISIKITVPGVGEIPVTTEINVPMGVIAGRY